MVTREQNRLNILVDLYLDDRSILSDRQKNAAWEEIKRRDALGEFWSVMLQRWVGGDDATTTVEDTQRGSRLARSGSERAICSGSSRTGL